MVILISTLTIGAFTYSAPKNEVDLSQLLNDSISDIKVGLDVVVHNPQGDVIGSYHEDEDIITHNFRCFINAICREDTWGNTETLYDNTNTSKTVQFFSDLIASSVFCYGATASIRIGNDSTAETVQDYKLWSEVDAVQVANSLYSDGNVTASATLNIDADQSSGICEAGLSCYWRPTTGGVSYDFLMFRDTFTPIVCTIGDTVTVTYTVQLINAGFNDNFGALLMCYLDEGADGIFEVTATSGTDYNITAKGTSGTNWLFDNAANTPYCGIIVGTGTTTETRSDYVCETPVSSLTKPSDPTMIYDSTSANVTFTSDIIIGSSYDLTEACFYINTRSDGGVSISVMLWRVTFSPYSYTASDTAAVTFRVEV